MTDKQKIEKAIKELREDGTLNLNIEVAEHERDILLKAGIIESEDDFDSKVIDKYGKIVRSCLEDEFGKKIEAGYFVESIVRDVIRQFIAG